jgi:hypothetical protein
MPSDEFADSVEEMIADEVVVDASMRFVREKTGGEGRDDVFERIVYRALVAAMQMARKQIAVPRVGMMTFAQAMQAVADDKMVTRPGWGILDALLRWGDADRPEIMYWTLDNLHGGTSGSGEPYHPSEEDRAATDWMEYQAPEIDTWVDYDA